MRLRIPAAIILAVMLMASSVWAQGFIKPAEAKKALQAAEPWLTLVDQGKYKESWQKAGPLFRKMVTQERWVEMLEKVRKPLGKTKARSVFVVEMQKNPPRSPKGEYLRLKFNTSFEKRKMNVETIALYKEKDGSLTMAGYFINPNATGMGLK